MFSIVFVLCCICSLLNLFSVVSALYWFCPLLYLLCIECVLFCICTILYLFSGEYILCFICSLLYLLSFVFILCSICSLLYLFSVVSVLICNCSLWYLSCCDLSLPLPVQFLMVSWTAFAGAVFDDFVKNPYLCRCCWFYEQSLLVQVFTISWTAYVVAVSTTSWSEPTPQTLNLSLRQLEADLAPQANSPHKIVGLR